MPVKQEDSQASKTSLLVWTKRIIKLTSTGNPHTCHLQTSFKAPILHHSIHLSRPEYRSRKFPRTSQKNQASCMRTTLQISASALLGIRFPHGTKHETSVLLVRLSRQIFSLPSRDSFVLWTSFWYWASMASPSTLPLTMLKLLTKIYVSFKFLKVDYRYW